jgi:hypothetical protein
MRLIQTVHAGRCMPMSFLAYREPLSPNVV